MDKVYLLLRNNLQTGPYTYEELLQQQLLPTDLIWVEGQSKAWMYPSELDTWRAKQTKPRAATPEAAAIANRPSSRQNTPEEILWYQKKRSPEEELEERALALRERVQTAAANPASYPSIPPRADTRQQKHTVYQEEEKPILLEMHAIHKKTVSLPQLIAAGVITALVATGWYNREVLHIVRPQQNAVTQAAAPAVFQVSLPTSPKPATIAVADTTPAQPKDSVATALAAAPVAAPKPKPVKVNEQEPLVATASETTVTEPPVVQTAAAEKKTPTDSAIASKTVEKENTAVAQTENDAAVEQPVTQKKKGLGQALKNIFKKKKKSEDKPVEEKADSE